MPKTILTRAAASVALALLLLAPGASAQGVTLLPLTDRAYADIERLGELGLLDSVIFGQRPYSRLEIGRIARDVCLRIGGAGPECGRPHAGVVASPAAEAIVRRLLHRFPARDDVRPASVLDGAALTLTSTDADRRGFPGNLVRRTEATIDPLAAGRLGRPATRGQTAALELGQRIELASWLGVRAAERVELRVPHDSSLDPLDAEWLIGSVRATYRNVALTVGREQFAWSPGEGEGLFLASSAPALDQLSLASDRPFRLPWVFRRLGPTRATIILADLGPSVVRSHSKLLAYKVSVQPSSTVELGGSFLNHYEGVGGRSSSVGNRLIDFMPFIDIFRKHNYDDPTRTLDVDSDKLLGIDGRVRVAPLGGMVVSGEVLIDDFDVNRISDLFGGYGSSMIAVRFPAVTNPDWALELNAKHMGILTYTHGALSSGITTRGRLLGDELGPDAKEFGLRIRWTPSPALRFTLGGRNVQYSDADYFADYVDPARTIFVVSKQRAGANELRDVVDAAFELSPDDATRFTLRAAAQRVRNAGFRTGRRRDYLLELGWRLSR